MISLRGLGFSHGAWPVLRSIDLEVRAGEIVGVVGPNGSGKTTLLKLIRGVLAPTAGEALLDGTPSHRIPRREAAQRIAVVQQGLSAAFPYPVREVVAMGRYARTGGTGDLRAQDREAVEAALALTETLSLADRPVTRLSGGELQRVHLARALAQDTPILLLDEAMSQLDLDHAVGMTQLLLRLNRERGTAVVHVSHDLELAGEISHRLLLLSRDGRPAAAGTPGEVLTSENLRQVYRVVVDVEENPRTGTPRLLRGAAG